MSLYIWIGIIGALVGASCGMIGCFLILREQSLMGEAISHAVLPGIALAVMFTGTLSSVPVLVGAGIIGVLTPFFVDVLSRTGLMYSDASLGTVFTVLFAIGVLLVTVGMGNVHLDTQCVLWGEIAYASSERWIIGGEPGIDMGPRSLYLLSLVFLVLVGFVYVFYKELKLLAFDEDLAHALRLHPRLVHYLLMGAIAMAAVASFEAVGAILVVALLIAPGAAAYLLTDRLDMMLVLGAVLGAISSIFGFGLAMWGGDLVGVPGGLSISGSMALMAGFVFGASFLFAPTHGYVTRMVRQWRVSRRLQSENFLVYLYRELEKGREAVSPADLEIEHGDWTRKDRRRMAKKLEKAGMVQYTDEKETLLTLTEEGRKRAIELLRSHRLWETFMHEKAGVAEDHVHRTADEMEHYLDEELRAELEEELSDRETDPQGKPIPDPPGESSEEN